MKKTQADTLYILDLDHTLIYGSFAPSESAKLLFQHNKYLKVYERPFAREFVRFIQEHGEVSEYTSAKANYAKTIINRLDIRVKETFTRRRCLTKFNGYKKDFRIMNTSGFSKVIIIDDSPNVWMYVDEKKVEMIDVKRFFGDSKDKELLEICSELKDMLKKSP